ncbi:hypothetical protein VTP01DRAFT_7247 [Rhizomucor pusillus]|uniref:uncharacterized protein n=1 Tax=Rhizomucor pusillus TaxID=4840 RepID=UPI003742D1BF
MVILRSITGPTYAILTRMSRTTMINNVANLVVVFWDLLLNRSRQELSLQCSHRFRILDLIGYRAVRHIVMKSQSGQSVVAKGETGCPEKNKIVDRVVLDFPVMGLRTVQNITLGWSTGRYCDNGIIDGAEIYAVRDTYSTQQDDENLQRLDSVNVSIYKADYEVLEKDKIYKIVSYGFGVFRGLPILIRAIKPRKIKGTRDMLCEIAEQWMYPVPLKAMGHRSVLHVTFDRCLV